MEHIQEEKRDFIGIGKIFYSTPEEAWNIPNLHFIVSKCDETTYEAINLEFGLVSIGESGRAAAEGLAKLSSSYFFSVVNEGNGFGELQELVRKNPFYDLWGEYRGIEFELAETSRDLSHYFDGQVRKTIHDLLDDRIKKAIDRKAEEIADDIISLVEETTSEVVSLMFEHTSVEYMEKAA